MALDPNSGSSLDNFSPQYARTANALSDELTRDLLGNQTNGPVGLAMHASTKANIKTTNAVKYTIGGKWYSLSAVPSQSIAALAAYPVAASSTAYFGVWVDAAGTLSFSNGIEEGFPPLDRALSVSSGRRVQKCFLGYVKIVTGSSATFTPGTTELDASGITATFQDCKYAPDPADL